MKVNNKIIWDKKQLLKRIVPLEPTDMFIIDCNNLRCTKCIFLGEDSCTGMSPKLPNIPYHTVISLIISSHVQKWTYYRFMNLLNNNNK